MPYNVANGWYILQATVTDNEGLTGTETMAIVVGEPFSLEMSPESGKWVVGDTIQVRDAHRTVVYLSSIEKCVLGCGCFLSKVSVTGDTFLPGRRST